VQQRHFSWSQLLVKCESHAALEEFAGTIVKVQFNKGVAVSGRNCGRQIPGFANFANFQASGYLVPSANEAQMTVTQWNVDHVYHGAIFAPGKRLKVPFRGDLIWFVLHVVFNYRGMKTSNIKFRRFAAVETHNDFVMNQGSKI